ncbi:hypothetical protein IE81DRAFT_244700 [Ceraceosorus guamensis]|uniref:Uncharacterized protein n=1 Tax=Ceraceosorus guamensis TaxID=1522189 RepID=A0A316VR75_9BASI|nr:hypothetical protein IE81DRAFT_244700 [Ceraceosorus guamensis]PWN40096.1 hypothetical protein IE81DRAFT_244700 [Ceraceosorus guamensis]
MAHPHTSPPSPCCRPSTSILTSSPLALLSLLGPSAKPHAHAIGLASSSASYSILGPPVQAGGVPLSDAGDDVQTRLEKTKEALKAQSDFARIALISVQTADISPKQRSLDIEYRLPLARTKSSSPSRSSRGLKLRLDIADAQSRRPQVTKMSILTLDRSIRASLGDDVLRIWESSGNVVALLIALRTRVGLVDARSALFDSLSNARPELVKRSGRREEERLIFTGAKDGQLILHFRIEHSRHGVASAVVSLDPVLPFGVRGSASKNLLQALPDMFRELLDAAPPGPDRILQSVLAVVDAFFDQH